MPSSRHCCWWELKCPQVSDNCHRKAVTVRSCWAMPDHVRLQHFCFVFWDHALFASRNWKDLPPDQGSTGAGGVVTCGGRTLMRDEPITLLTLGLLKATGTSNWHPGHRDVGGWIWWGGDKCPLLSGPSSLPALKRTLAVNIGILEWQNPSSCWGEPWPWGQRTPLSQHKPPHHVPGTWPNLLPSQLTHFLPRYLPPVW